MNRKTNLLVIGLLLLSQLKAQDNTEKDASQYTLFPHEVTLAPGASIDLKVYFEPNNNPGEIKQLDIIPTWQINGHTTPQPGDGNLSNPLVNKITYTAPSVSPAHDPVITANIVVYNQGSDSANANKVGLKMILYCTVHVLDEPNFFSISGPLRGSKGTLYKIKEPVLQASRQSAEMAFEANSTWNIHISGADKSGNELTMRLSFAGNGAGTYPWKMEIDNHGNVVPPVTAAAVTATRGEGGNFNYASLQLPGSIVVKTFDPQTKIIRGFFSGPMMNANKETVFVAGGFSAYMR